MTPAFALSLRDALPELDHDAKKRLKRHEVLTSAVTDAKEARATGQAIGLFHAPPEDVLAVLWDVARYQTFIPRIKDSRVAHATKTAIDVVIETSFPWPIKSRWVHARMTRQRQAPQRYEVRWQMLRGNFKAYEGKATLYPLANGTTAHKTLVVYQTTAAFETHLPRFLRVMAVRNVSEMMVHYLREQLTRLQARGKFPRGQPAATVHPGSGFQKKQPQRTAAPAAATRERRNASEQAQRVGER